MNKLRIPVTTSIGQGETTLAAFDSALHSAGVANTNLVRLSSVIPPGTQIENLGNQKIDETPGEWGDRLHVVYAEMRTQTVGQEAWAGIGWVQDPSDGKGLFVEHEGHDEEEVAESIRLSLNGLVSTRGMERNFPEQQSVIIGTQCEQAGIAVCALAVAVYQASSWDNEAYIIGQNR